MPRRASMLALPLALIALAGCGSGGDEKSGSTTTATTTAAADRPALSTEESRRHALAVLGRWTGQIVDTLKTINIREVAGQKGLREQYFKADGKLHGLYVNLGSFPGQVEHYAPPSLLKAMQEDADAWKQWAVAISDIRAAAGAGMDPDALARGALLAHLSAYKAAGSEAPPEFRAAARRL